MSIHPIIKMGHPTLRQVAKTVAPEDIDSAQMHTLIADMIETLHDAGGIGLAAPQINQPIQLAIIEVPGGPSRYGEIEPIPLTVFFNPVLTVLNPEEAGYWRVVCQCLVYAALCIVPSMSASIIWTLPATTPHWSCRDFWPLSCSMNLIIWPGGSTSIISAI